MVNVAEDIEISADASKAISEMRKLESAVIKSMEAAGASSKELNSISKGLEGTFARVAASAVRAGQKTSSTIKSEVQETKGLISATEALERAKRKAAEATGVRENSRGQLVDSQTGRFASAEQKAKYAEIALAERLRLSEVALDRQRANNAQSAYAYAQRQAQAANIETEAYRKRQAQLERTFSGSIVGLANPDATKLQKFANVLNQIPPATWNQKLNQATESIMGMSNSTRYALYEVANSATIAGAAFIAFGALSIRAAVAHERAFANVERTTQTTAAGYEVLRRQLEVLSMELPVTYEELTNIATAAGQLGIGASGVAQFTRVVAQLTATTNLTSDAAGVALARFRTFFAVTEGESPALAVTESTFSNLASSILKVGVNSIATESGIVNVAVQIASMGDYAGFTANQVIGLAGALSSIGVAPELSRGTVTRTFSLIGNAVSANGIQLEKFAALAGVSADRFRQAWGTEDFAGIFTRMLKGINEFGGDANLMLQELGFNSVRDRPLLLRLASAADEAGVSGELLSQTLRDAYDGWVQNAELAMQYSKISQTTSARIQVLGQSFEQLAAGMGEQSGGFLGELATQLTAVVRGFEAFSNTDAGQTLGTIAVQGSLVVGALLLIVGAAARSAASIQAIGQAWTAMSAKGATAATTLSLAFRGLSAALGVIGIIGAIAGIVGGFIAMNDAAQVAKRGVQDVNGLVSAMAEDGKAGADGITYYADANKQAAAEQKNAAIQASSMTEALYGITAGAKSGASGMDSLANSASRAKFVFGDAAQEFYRSQLLQSENFQKLFDPSKAWNAYGSTMGDLGIDAVKIDWDKLMIDSVKKGGIDKEAFLKSLLDATGVKQFDPVSGEISEGYRGVKAYADEVINTFSNLSPEIQRTINAQNTLQGQSKETFSEIVDGASDASAGIGDLDEVTQKMIDGIAQGFAKFADTSSLIGLTQKMNEIMGQTDVSAGDKAAQWEQAWTDAYGGAQFSLESYLSVFGRAAGEQEGFIENLQVLRSRMSSLGPSDAVINDLAAMGPEANRLVQALVQGTDEQLTEFETLWGQTGYDSMLLFATQAAIGQEVVNNVMRTGGLDALRAFNSSLASDIGVDEALAALQLDVNGNPIAPATKPPVFQNATEDEKRRWAQYNTLTTTARVRFIGSAAIRTNPTSGGHSVESEYSGGGYTGPGSKYQEAGVVHADEFVFTKEATRAIGVGNLYSLMHQAQRGRGAPRGRGGYSGGGRVMPQANGGDGYIGSFGPLAVQQMMSAFRQIINLDGKAISNNSASQYANDTAIGAY